MICNTCGNDRRVWGCRCEEVQQIADLAVLWFIWKRLNNILYDPQRVLPFEFKPLPRSCFVR